MLALSKRQDHTTFTMSERILMFLRSVQNVASCPWQTLGRDLEWKRMITSSYRILSPKDSLIYSRRYDMLEVYCSDGRI